MLCSSSESPQRAFVVGAVTTPNLQMRTVRPAELRVLSGGSLVRTRKPQSQDCDPGGWLQSPALDPPPYCALVRTGRGGQRDHLSGAQE